MTVTPIATVNPFDPQGRLVFEPEPHRYVLTSTTNAARELIGVTTAIGEGLAGVLGEEWWTEYTALRGSMIHDAILYASQNDLDYDQTGGAVADYLPSLKRFFDEEHPEVLHAEQPIFDEPYGYGGRFDLLCRLMGPRRATQPNVLDLIDAKTASIPRTVGMQTAAYKRQIQLVYPGCLIRRWVWQLKTNGTYKLEEVSRWPDAHQHEQQFLAVLLTAQLKRSYKS